ncbi:MAG: 3-dehydroquinate synthase [Weeksellaceae bacterium]
MAVLTPIYFADISPLNQYIRQNAGNKYFFIVDDNTHDFCLPYLLSELEFIQDIEIIEIPSGEAAKEIEVANQVWQSLLELGADRNSIVINCGGGVVTDFGGFVASTFKRGIRFINVPTSLLAMVDASVGGKTGINLNHSKNQIGTFAQPEMVIIFPEFLETLPENQLRSGFAEMLKHGLIQSPKHWTNLTQIQSLTPENVEPYILDSIQIKKDVVVLDPTEKGLRKILNAGHTLGHALESWYLDNHLEITHGEAVALGLVLESYIAKELDVLANTAFENILKGIQKFYHKLDLPEREQILKYLQQDKKNQDGVIQFILLNDIGQCTYQTYAVPEMLIDAAFDFYNNHYE